MRDESAADAMSIVVSPMKKNSLDRTGSAVNVRQHKPSSSIRKDNATSVLAVLVPMMNWPRRVSWCVASTRGPERAGLRGLEDIVQLEGDSSLRG